MVATLLNRVRLSPLPVTELVVLSAVVESEGLTPPSIQQEFFPEVSRQYVGVVIKRLREAGYVTTVPDPSHGKRVIVLATKAGVDLWRNLCGQ